MKLKCISSAALEFVRKYIVPLPCETSLLEKLAFMKCAPGLLYPAYEYLRGLPPRMNDPNECLSALVFDEMKLDDLATYDSKLDAVLGPHMYAQQVYVRSLIADWELPILVEFDKAITKDSLHDIIIKMEVIGIKIMIVVCDQGPSNQSLAGALGITNENVSFVNPHDSSRNVVFINDMVHLHKSLR